MKILDYFYTESQAAKQLGLNRITIWRWIKAGKLNIQRIGGIVFISKEEIESLKSTKAGKSYHGVSQQALINAIPSALL